MPTKAILLDIEGTICPVSFVRDVLFPHALRSLPQYLSDHWTSADFASTKSSFPPSATTSPSALIAHVEALTAQDVKVPALKALQGSLWRAGYESGEIVAPLYPDVMPAVRGWVGKGMVVAVYSSGSVEAQELLVRHTNEGDVERWFCGFFDTVCAGGKMEAGSYGRIAEVVGVAVGEWLFLSDSVGEVEAAREAGMMAGVVVREGNAPLGEEVRGGHWVVERGFEEVVERVCG